MTLQEIEKSLSVARLQLGNRDIERNIHTFDGQAKKQQLIALIKDLKRRRKEALAALKTASTMEMIMEQGYKIIDQALAKSRGE